MGALPIECRHEQIVSCFRGRNELDAKSGEDNGRQDKTRQDKTTQGNGRELGETEKSTSLAERDKNNIGQQDAAQVTLPIA